MTDQPAPVSTSAAVAPAGPVPTTTASQSRGSGTPGHLVVGVAARLHVTFETDGAPTRAVAIAAVLGHAERRSAGMRIERWYEPIGRGGDHAVFVIGQKARHYGRERPSGTIFRRILANVARSRRLNARRLSGASYIRASTWLRIF